MLEWGHMEPVQLNVLVDPELKRMVGNRARLERTSQGKVVEAALREYLYGEKESRLDEIEARVKRLEEVAQL